METISLVTINLKKIDFELCKNLCSLPHNLTSEQLIQLPKLNNNQIIISNLNDKEELFKKINLLNIDDNTRQEKSIEQSNLQKFEPFIFQFIINKNNNIKKIYEIQKKELARDECEKIQFFLKETISELESKKADCPSEEEDSFRILINKLKDFEKRILISLNKFESKVKKYDDEDEEDLKNIQEEFKSIVITPLIVTVLQSIFTPINSIVERNNEFYKFYFEVVQILNNEFLSKLGLYTKSKEEIKKHFDEPIDYELYESRQSDNPDENKKGCIEKINRLTYYFGDDENIIVGEAVIW